MGEIMKTFEKIIEFFDIYRKARHNRNAHRYYKALYEFKKIETIKISKELNDEKQETKDLKEKIILLTQENQSYISENKHLREKIENLENKLKPFKKHQFKKGCVPWNKGRKFTKKEDEKTE